MNMAQDQKPFNPYLTQQLSQNRQNIPSKISSISMLKKDVEKCAELENLCHELSKSQKLNAMR